MRREPGDLDRHFDVLVVGGGVYGACIARMAARQGYSVALVERADFGSGVSHNSLKIIHGGFRYVQHLDLPRIRESVAAQRAWLAAAPHLVRPMRCIAPAQGLGTRGPAAFAAAVCAYHLLAGRRNKGLPDNTLPWSGVLSRRVLLARHPELAGKDLAGGAYWYDAQMLDANRLVLECLQDACANDAVVLNHVEVAGLRRTAGAVEGALVRDVLDGREFEVRADITVNAAGPSVSSILAAGSRPLAPLGRTVWTRNVNIVTRRLFDTPDAIGVSSQRPSDAVVGKSNRLFFVTSWQDCSIVGTSHVRHRSDDDMALATASDAASFLREIRDALPEQHIGKDDVRYVHAGLTPAEDEVHRTKRGTVLDHRRTEGVSGLITVLGIKFTTAPNIAASVLTLIQAMKPRTAAADGTDFSTPLPGAPDRLPDAVPWDRNVTDEQWAQWIYGRRWPDVAAMLPADESSDTDHVFRCRVLHGIAREMVMRLPDAVFRASDLAERGQLSAARLQWCANQMANRFGWTEERKSREIASVEARLQLKHDATRDTEGGPA
mgnify:CR=1 FL=1